MKLSPKQSFQSNESLVKKHADTVDSADFITAAEAALLHIVMSITDTTDPVMATAGFQRIMGARMYLNELLTIADKSKPVEKSGRPSELNYKA